MRGEGGGNNKGTKGAESLSYSFIIAFSGGKQIPQDVVPVAS